MKTSKLLQIFSISVIAFGMILAGFAFIGTSYGAGVQTAHSIIAKKNAELVKLYVKILNKVGHSSKAAMEVEKRFDMSPAQVKLYAEKGMGLGDAVFIKMVKENAENNMNTKAFTRAYLMQGDAISQLKNGEVRMKNIITEMGNAVKLKVVNEAYKTETGVSVDHVLSLSVNGPNVKLENYATNKGSINMTNPMQNKTMRMNAAQRQINQVDNTQRQMKQMSNIQHQIQQNNNLMWQTTGR